MTPEEYRAKIDRLIRDGHEETILNGTPEHAAIITERMFANAVQSVRILAERLDGRIFGAADTVEQAKLFLASGEDHVIKVLIEHTTTEQLRTHPLLTDIPAAQINGQIEVRRLPAAEATNLPFNFSLMDDRGYRFEADKREPVASAAFGGGSLMEKISRLFDQLWNSCARVNLTVGG